MKLNMYSVWHSNPLFYYFYGWPLASASLGHHQAMK